MATLGSIRYLAACQIRDLLRASADLAGVQIEIGFPGEEMATDVIFLASEDSTYEVPTSKTGRLHRTETFMLTWIVWAGVPGRTIDAAFDRRIAMEQAFDSVLADDASLDLAGVIKANFSSSEGTTARLREGAWSSTTIEIEVEARYT